MSFVAFDIIEAVETLLHSEGWSRSALQPGGPLPRMDRQTKIYEHGEDVAVICRPLSPIGGFGRIRGRGIPSIGELADMLDRYLVNLVEVLKRIRRAYSGRFVLVFKRGGIPIPEWFLALCAELGIQLKFLEDSTEELEDVFSWASPTERSPLDEEMDKI